MKKSILTIGMIGMLATGANATGGINTTSGIYEYGDTIEVKGECTSVQTGNLVGNKNAKIKVFMIDNETFFICDIKNKECRDVSVGEHYEIVTTKKDDLIQSIKKINIGERQ